jgi:hypothetical protein
LQDIFPEINGQVSHYNCIYGLSKLRSKLFYSPLKMPAPSKGHLSLFIFIEK